MFPVLCGRASRCTLHTDLIYKRCLKRHGGYLWSHSGHYPIPSKDTDPISKSAVKNEYISYRTLLLYIKTAAYHQSGCLRYL